MQRAVFAVIVDRETSVTLGVHAQSPSGEPPWGSIVVVIQPNADDRTALRTDLHPHSHPISWVLAHIAFATRVCAAMHVFQQNGGRACVGPTPKPPIPG